MTTTITADRTAATRFFWAWLITATAVSIAGNVAHALHNPAAASTTIAAAAAVVPPIVLLGALHGVHALVRSRITGGTYRAALSITIALALCAFVLSFAALRDLAITWAGIPALIAWLWPLAIDLSITGSTIALLALTNAQRTDQLTTQPIPASAQLTARVAQVTVHAAHTHAAERIRADGVTRIERDRLAEVIAEHAAGTAPSMIARKLNVGYSTVQRIVAHPGAQITDEQGAA